VQSAVESVGVGSAVGEMKAQLFLCFLEAWRGVAIDSRVVALAGRRVLAAAPWKVFFIDDSTAQLVFAALFQKRKKRTIFAASHSLTSCPMFW